MHMLRSAVCAVGRFGERHGIFPLTLYPKSVEEMPCLDLADLIHRSVFGMSEETARNLRSEDDPPGGSLSKWLYVPQPEDMGVFAHG